MIWAFIIGGYLAAVAIAAAILHNAPRGWESDDGFHFGDPEE